jgi:transposase-like protein
MNSQLREQAIKLRTEKDLSYTEIRKRLGITKSSLSYWLREFPLSEERILELRRQGWISKKKRNFGRMN